MPDQPAGESNLLRRLFPNPIAILAAVAAVVVAHRLYVSRVQRPASVRVHPPAPAEYRDLVNPFENPRACVVVQDVGPDREAVRAIVQNAVAHRTESRADDLLKQLPAVVCETTSRESADELAAKLREAGAKCAVDDAVDRFAALVESDADTPIGRPSQVLAHAISSRKLDRQTARRAYVAFKTAEGRALYQVHCRPCHGAKGSGDGPAAGGFALRPANFRDPKSLAAMKPGEVLWRIERGSPGLPNESTPWDSAMPAWRHELDRELAWKIVLGAFSTADVEESGTPPHRSARPSAVGSTGSPLPPRGWLDWPVPPRLAAATVSDPQFMQRGRHIYYYRCMPCHGAAGAGDGPAANTMWPRPRDFTDVKVDGFDDQKTQPKFKFRTTRQGWLPTDEDLYRTISRGLVGTAMEGWSDVLSADEIWQVIAAIKTFSSAWNDPEHFALNPNDPAVVREYTEPDGSGPIFRFESLTPPAVTPQLLHDGAQAYRRAGCWQCHGVEARGDGPALGQHYDAWGYRAWPQNLTSPLNFKAGHAIKDIYRDFTAGLDGTVMPTLPADVLDTDPRRGEYLRWAVATYIHNLVQTPPDDADPGRSRIVRVRPASRPLPADPLAVEWDRITGASVPLSGQVIAPPRWSAPSVNQVSVKAAYDADRLAVWLRWSDRRPNVAHVEPPDDLEPADVRALGPKTYLFPALRPKAPVTFDARDQIELQWPEAAASDATRPPLLFGDAERPVILWRWHADRQGLTVRKEVVTIGGSQADRLVCSADSGDESSTAVDVLRAAGADHPPETVATPSLDVRSRAHWANGSWTLVITAPGASIRTDGSRTVPMAIHIWDGLAGETKNRMAISGWLTLAFDPEP
jgi:mono/diheme cytochrome c family protein